MRLNVLANSWHSFGTHTRYLHRLFLLRPSYIDTVINDADRADVIIGFSKTSYLTHFDKDASIIDVRYEPRVTRFLLFFLFLSLYIILFETLNFSLCNKLSRSIIFVTRCSRQFVRDFRFSDPSIIRFCFDFITLVLFLLFDSLKNNDVEKQEQIFEDGDSTISINRFRVRII